jgi:hypothetical protein
MTDDRSYSTLEALAHGALCLDLFTWAGGMADKQLQLLNDGAFGEMCTYIRRHAVSPDASPQRHIMAHGENSAVLSTEQPGSIADTTFPTMPPSGTTDQARCHNGQTQLSTAQLHCLSQTHSAMNDTFARIDLPRSLHAGHQPSAAAEPATWDFQRGLMQDINAWHARSTSVESGSAGFVHRAGPSQQRGAAPVQGRRHCSAAQAADNADGAARQCTHEKAADALAAPPGRSSANAAELESRSDDDLPLGPLRSGETLV